MQRKALPSLCLLVVCLCGVPSLGFAHKEIKPDEKQPLAPDDPLGLVSSFMKKSEQGLSNSLIGEDAQTAQEDALSLLDSMIRAAEQQQQQQQNQQQNQQQKQQQQKQQQEKEKQQKEKQQKEQEQKEKEKKQSEDSKKPIDKEKITGGTTGQGEQKALEAEGEEWGSMPPQLRRELIQSVQEGLPEKYKELLKLYYKRLSDLESSP